MNDGAEAGGERSVGTTAPAAACDRPLNVANVHAASE